MKPFKRSAVTVAGIALILGGLAMMVLPGPGIIVAVGGLAVLATEYVWARRALGRAKKKAEQAQEQAVASTARTVATLTFAVGMLVVGSAMLVVDDVPWPIWDSMGDSLWDPVTGSVVIVTSLVLLNTTVLALRDSDRQGISFLQS